MKIQRVFKCAECDVDVLELHEYSYMVTKKTWREMVRRWPGASHRDLLCVDCLQERLGRELTSKDFAMNVPLNRDWLHQSRRLLEVIYRDRDTIPTHVVIALAEKYRKKYAKALADLSNS